MSADPAGRAGHRDHPPRMGFFTDTSVCIGCKACEVACKEWNLVPEDGLSLSGMSYDNTVGLGASTWRHVAFIEQPVSVAVDAAEGLRWLMASDVCKHCTESACLDVCPTGALFRTEFGTVVVQDDVCNGCGYCVPACPFGVIDRREQDGQAHKCTLCYDRLGAGLSRPAQRRARPTRSSSARLMSCASGPGCGSRTCRRPASTRRSCTWPIRRMASAAAGRSSCCSMSPRSTACRPIRSSPPATCRACGNMSPSPRRGSPPRRSRSASAGEGEGLR